jgi:YidC/Oxa1 family membrane protein insertase
MSAVLGVPVDAAYHLVLALSNVLTPVLGGLAAAAGVIVFTMAVRLLVMPLSFRALRGQAAQARLAPQIQALRKRYSRQPERLQRELTALYQREGTSMFAGFGPILAQWPVFSVLYLLFRSPRVAGGPNLLLSRDLFGVPLGAHWPGGGGLLSAQSTVFLAVFAVLAIVCWLSGLLARRTAAGPATQASGVPALIGKVLPFVTVVIAAFAPLAGGIYLTASVGWSAAERRLFLRSRVGKNAEGESKKAGVKTVGAKIERRSGWSRSDPR